MIVTKLLNVVKIMMIWILHKEHKQKDVNECNHVGHWADMIAFIH